MVLDRLITVISDVQNIATVLNSVQQGDVFLYSGKHVQEIKTRKAPQELWLSIQDNGNMQVCNGNVDKVGYTLTTDGFVLYADVVSDSLQVGWYALFELPTKN